MDEKGNGDALKARFTDWIAMLKTADESAKATFQPNWESEDVPIHPLRLAGEINAFMDKEDDIVVADGGDTQIPSISNPRARRRASNR